MDLISNITPDILLDKTILVIDALKNEEVWRSIPLVSSLDNFDQLKEMQLVRFRGLVQDMMDPEIYLEIFQTKNSSNELKTHNGKYRENIKLQENEELLLDSDVNVHKERRSIFMVSIPGLNEWAVDIDKKSGVAGNPQQNEGDTVETGGVKRPLEEDSEMETSEPGDVVSKKPPTEKADDSARKPNLSKEFFLNSPIADRPSKASLVKFYEDVADLALNDVVEVVGFISMDPLLCGSNQAPSEFDNFDEVCASNPPPSLIPRIHAVTHRKLTHLNPLLHEGIDNELTDQLKEEAAKDIRLILTQCLMGDTIAADYLFCHLISTVYVRGDETLGQYSINLTNFPASVLPDYTKRFYEILELLLPASHYLPVTLENLNNTEFIPTKDYETGKLASGLLQLAPHTHLVLDETQLQPGKLESSGIDSVMHISNLIRSQTLNVNFKFYNIDYNSNVPVLLLSEGKSMFPSNCHVPVMPDEDSVRLINETFAAIRQFIKPKLQSLRVVLTTMRLKQFDMSPENMSMIQNDFVEMRKSFNATAEDLHSMLILSRMLGIIESKTTLDAECWSRAKRMEEERRKRISSLPKK